VHLAGWTALAIKYLILVVEIIKASLADLGIMAEAGAY